MNNFDTILKDIGGIHSLLLDHSAMTQKEIKLFLREFEQKRNDREVQNLSQALELSTDAESALLPGCLELAAQHLATLQEKLYECEAICRESEDREFEKKRIRTASSFSETSPSTGTTGTGATASVPTTTTAALTVLEGAQSNMSSSFQLP